MTDQYQAFTQSPIGKFVVKNLGLPSPVVLERFESAQPVVNGAVLVGAAPSSVLSGAIAQVLSNIHADSYVGNNVALQQEAAKVGLNLRPFNAGDKESKFKAVVFDASGIQNSEQLNELYKFFNPIARQVATSGRVIVIGTTPETAKTVKQAIAQRALEGFIKSVGKEFKKGITAVLVGAAPSSVLSGAIAQVLSNIHADSYVGNNVALQQEAAKVGLNLRPFNAGDKESKFKAVVFDASGIQNSEQLNELYKFFNPIARQVATSGRVIVIGTTPETAKTVKQAIAQRALEGFIKSVGKEFKKGITAQVVYVDEGAAANLESTLRFLLSPRSAYVSGQVIRVSKADVVDVDWAKPLAGKTALVTGASRGIGEAIAHVLARDGAHVICLDVPQQQADLDRVAADIGGSTLAIDITAADAGEKIKAAAAKQGGLDIIVHNAGITRDKTLANMKPELWDLVININLSAAERVNNYLLEITRDKTLANMKPELWDLVININLSAAERVNDYLLENDGLNANGRIVCVSSISGIAGNLGQTNYAASKAGVIGLVKFTAPILKNGITINAVAPGFIETQMTAAIPFAIREAGRRMNSMQQGGLPVDVAETIAWFASTASTGVNGNVVRVCGQSLLGA